MTTATAQDLDQILAKAQDFIKTKVIPLEPEMAGKEWEEYTPMLDELRQEVKKMGMWTPQVPKEYGGMGLSLLEHGKLLQVLGRTPFGMYVFNCQAPDAGNMEILMEFGTDEQKKRG